MKPIIRKNYVAVMALGLSLLMSACGQNDAKDDTPSAAIAPAGTFTNYGTNGQQTTNYQICSDNPQQYCATQCQSQVNFGGCQPGNTVIRVQRYTVYVPAFQEIQTRACGDQIRYDRAGSCVNGNQFVVLGSLRVISPAPGEIRMQWNHNSEAHHYRVVAHGLMNMTSSWVSEQIFGNSVTLTRGTLGGSTSYAGTKMPTALNSIGVPLGVKVPLAEGEPYWYEIVAYNASGQSLKGHLNQDITRTFDFVQTNCGGVIVAGFCSL